GLAKQSYLDFKSIVITVIVGGLLVSKKIHPILVIVIAALLGIGLYI
ncbi:MAG: chromate transporter, partial [Clostridium sp.]